MKLAMASLLHWTLLACLADFSFGSQLKTAHVPSPWAAAGGTGPKKADWSSSPLAKKTPTFVAAKKPNCGPKCWWQCVGEASCQEECEPVCAPPVCQTSCRPINSKTCKQTCSEPQCAVICPQKECGGNEECGKCKTVCGEPECKVTCDQDCVSTCADPLCDWKCKPSINNCPKPKCDLKCGPPPGCPGGPSLDPKKTPVAELPAAKDPQVPSGATVVSKGLASLDAEHFDYAPSTTAELTASSQAEK